MQLILGSLLVSATFVLLGVCAWFIDEREREERLLAEKLEASRLLDESLEERLREVDQYRHDLAAVVQRLGLEQVRIAEEQARQES